MTCVPVDRRYLEKILYDGVTTVFTVKEIWPNYKTPVFRMEFGLTVCPRGKLRPAAESILFLLIHIN